MKLAQLKKLIAHGESELLEFKNSTGSISSGMQTVCAFLNSAYGGTVIFGVKDDSHIVGQIVTDKTRKDIAVEINKIEPYAKITIEYVRVIDDRYAIVLLVHPGEKAPYTYDGRAFIRNQTTTTRMPKEEYLYLANKNNPELWEKSPNNSCTIKDLDHKRIKEVINKAVIEKRLPKNAALDTIPSILKKLGLMAGEKLTNAAVVLFCKDEYKQFIQANIKLARFKGLTKSEFLDTKRFRGHAFDLYEKAEAFLLFMIPVAARVIPGRSDRVETPAIPYTVLREALINALAHRDYSHPGGSIDVAVYDDRVEISNNGFLPKGLNIKQLSKVHKSILRNPLIAEVFYLCGEIEKWGRGTLDMIRHCKNAENPLPKFEEIGGGFSVCLPFKDPIITTINKQLSMDQVQLNDRQLEIIDILKEGPHQISQVLEKMKDQISQRTLQRELGKLKKLNLIKTHGKTKSIVWSLIEF